MQPSNGKGLVLKNTRTCNKCRAFEYFRVPCRCEFGFMVKRERIQGLLLSDSIYRPMQPCPKPLTIKDYLLVKHHIDSQRKVVK